MHAMNKVEVVEGESVDDFAVEAKLQLVENLVCEGVH